MKEEKGRTILLERWWLEKYGNEIRGRGIVTGHEKILDGTLVHTSKISVLEFLDDRKEFHMRTVSGSQYRLPLWLMKEKAGGEIGKYLDIWGISPKVLEEFQKERKEKYREMKERVAHFLHEKEMYLCRTGRYTRIVYIKDAEGKIYRQEPEPDSISIAEWDFRSYGMPNSGQGFSFKDSDTKPLFIDHLTVGEELENVWLENTGCGDVIICGYVFIRCPPGKMVCIRREDVEKVRPGLLAFYG